MCCEGRWGRGAAEQRCARGGPCGQGKFRDEVEEGALICVAVPEGFLSTSAAGGDARNMCGSWRGRLSSGRLAEQVGRSGEARRVRQLAVCYGLETLHACIVRLCN